MGVLRSFVTTMNSHDFTNVSDCWSGKQLNAEGVLTTYSGEKYDDEDSKDIVDKVSL